MQRQVIALHYNVTGHPASAPPPLHSENKRNNKRQHQQSDLQPEVASVQFTHMF